MSKYSAKKQPTAACAHRSCPHPGTTLAVVAGRPDWYCAEHTPTKGHR